MTKYKNLVVNELKRVGHDNLLLVMALYPILLVLMGRFLVPFLRDIFLSPTFDLVQHYPAIVVFLILANPYIYGALLAFMILDEREERTIQAIQVMPIKLSHYLGVKIFIFFGIAMITGVALIQLLNLLEITLMQAVIINIVLSLATPFNMIFINSIVNNKIEGFAAVKGTGVLIMIPLVVFYLPERFHIIAGIIPGYWPAMAIYKIENPGLGFMPYWGYCLIGMIYILLVTLLFYKRFQRKLLT